VEEEPAIGPGAARDVVVIGSVILANGAPVPPLDAVGAVKWLALVWQAGQADARIVEEPPALAVADEQRVGLGLDEAFRLLALGADPHRLELFFGRFLLLALVRPGTLMVVAAGSIVVILVFSFVGFAVGVA
jgi:hypothetical protein